MYPAGDLTVHNNIAGWCQYQCSVQYQYITVGNQKKGHTCPLKHIHSSLTFPRKNVERSYFSLLLAQLELICCNISGWLNVYVEIM